jgi:lactate permease
MPTWEASVLALLAGLGVATLVYGMPPRLAIASAWYGAAFGLFALGYLVYSAILLFDIAVASGRFELIQQSISSISTDSRLQAVIIAFAFGAFLEGASGAGTPVAVSASLLAGIGFPPITAAALSLLANTAPVAFGALGLPIITLAAVTGLPLNSLSMAAGRICPIVALIVPTYLVTVFSGISSALHVWPVLAICGIVFAVTQFFVSNYIGPFLTDILAALVTMLVVIVFASKWKPVTQDTSPEPLVSPRQALRGWMPYLILVVTVLVWGAAPAQRLLDRATVQLKIASLHNVVQRTTPIVPVNTPYPAVLNLNWLGAAGTACLLAALLSAAVSRMSLVQTAVIAGKTARRLAFSEATIACVLALAYVMNYSGATSTLGLALASTGTMLPFFGAYLGWLGTFLTGSDTSTNALFGPLQVVSAQAVNINPITMCAVNTCGGVTGKMISIQNIAVAAAATKMKGSEEGELFRLTLKHSIILAGLVGLIALMYVYAVPELMPAVRNAAFAPS